MTRPISIERVAYSDEPRWSPFGYIVNTDGTLYSLTEAYTHGVLLALLYPEIAEEQGYEPPDSDFDVMEYQRFELDHTELFPVVRVSKYLSKVAFNFSDKFGVNEEQRVTLSKIIKLEDLSLHSKIMCKHGDISMREFLKLCEESNE